MPETRCPACGSEAKKLWESIGEINGGSWFTGLYNCPRCWHFKASGTERDGNRKIIQWHPSCPYHGADPVVVTTCERHDYMTHDTEWTCTVCSRRMAVVDGKIETTWKPYDPVFLEYAAPASIAEVQRIGGLPHD